MATNRLSNKQVLYLKIINDKWCASIDKNDAYFELPWPNDANVEDHKSMMIRYFNPNREIIFDMDKYEIKRNELEVWTRYFYGHPLSEIYTEEQLHEHFGC